MCSRRSSGPSSCNDRLHQARTRSCAGVVRVMSSERHDGQDRLQRGSAAMPRLQGARSRTVRPASMSSASVGSAVSRGGASRGSIASPAMRPPATRGSRSLTIQGQTDERQTRSRRVAATAARNPRARRPFQRSSTEVCSPSRPRSKRTQSGQQPQTEPSACTVTPIQGRGQVRPVAGAGRGSGPSRRCRRPPSPAGPSSRRTSSARRSLLPSLTGSAGGAARPGRCPRRSR